MRNSILDVHHRKVCALADIFLNEAMTNGEAFSGGLSNWAIEKAEEQLGRHPPTTEGDYRNNDAGKTREASDA